MNWLYYLIEANIYLVVFYSFYILVLQRETFYMLNRFYLLFTSLMAFVLPFFQLSGLRSPIAASIHYSDIVIVNVPQVNVEPEFWTIPFVCTTLYFFIALYFLIRLCWRLYKILRLTQGACYTNGIKVIEMPGKNVSFSFFRCLFIDPELPAIATIIRHEKIHIRQRHSIDVLFFELLHIINWFNPIILFIKKEIKAIHEFIADEETLDKDIDAENYSMFLINRSYHVVQPILSNQMFNSHLLEKRIIRLYQKRSHTISKWKYILMMPLLLLMICISSVAFTKSYAALDLMPQKEKHISTPEKVYKESISEKHSPHKAKPALKETVKKKYPKEAVSIVPKEQNPIINIDARTDTVKIRTVPGKMVKETFKGIYVVDDKIYTEQELRNALKATGKMDIVLPNRPLIGLYTPNDENAVKRWGTKARQGVVFVISPKDSTANSAYP